MENKFKALFELPENLYKKGSPVIILSGTLLLDYETHRLFIRLRFLSISSDPIQSIKIRIQQTDNAHRPIEVEKEVPYLDLNVMRNETFGFKKPIYLKNKETRGFSVYVSEVVFSSGKIWNCLESDWFSIPMPSPLPELYPHEEQLVEFRHLFGETATKVPQKLDRAGIWHCACGNLCRDDEEKCPICGASIKEMLSVDGDTLQKDGIYLIASQNAKKNQISSLEKAIAGFSQIPGWKDADEQLEKCKEKFERRKKEIEIADKKKRKARKKFIWISSVSLSVVIFLITFFLILTKVIIPAKDLKELYNNAVAYAESGDLVRAYQSMKSVESGYNERDSILENIQNTVYKNAIKLAKQGNYQAALDLANAVDAPYEFRSACEDIVKNEKYQEYVALGNVEIIIANDTTSIEWDAFYDCTSLTSVTIPDSVTSIGAWAFYNCTGLTSVTIGNSVTSIEYDAFYGCTGIESIMVAEGNPVYHSDGNCLIETASKTLIVGCKNSVIPIDGSVTSIGSDAFEYCTGLTNVTIPDSVTSIGGQAFYGCTGLTNITIGNSVTSIGERAFSDCTATIRWGDHPTITTIGEYSFSGYKGTSITIPGSVTSIEKNAFGSCTGLTSVTIPNSVTSIGEDAFYKCTSLKNITIPFVGATKDGTSNTHFGYIFGASYFSDNSEYVPSSLKTVVITGGSSIGELAFYDCTGLTSVTIPEGVTDIGEDAFYSCTSLTSVTIGNGVTSIWSSAFENCFGLTSITIPNSVTSIGGWAFYNCSSLTSITYKGTKAQWNAISKESYWNYSTDDYTIHCTDGDF